MKFSIHYNLKGVFMDKNDFNFLKFRTDLIELLNKYKFELSGTCFDDGTMNVHDIRSGKNHVISDSINYYQVYDEEDFIEEYILSFFKDNKESRLNNSKIGIFTNDYFKASNFFTNLYHSKRQEIDFYRNSESIQEIKLLDGTQYLWIKPIDNSRGHRVEKAYIDRNLTLNELCYIVVPICVYCTTDNVKII
jgi:hypothetical protein